MMGLTYDDLKEEFEREVRADKKATQLYTKIYNGKGTYRTASELSARIGDDFGKVLRRHSPNDLLVDWDIEDLIPRALGLDHQMVVDACREVQKNLNKNAGLNLKYQEPKFNTDRAYGIVSELQENPGFTNIEKTFYDQFTNFSMNVVDDSIRDNADFMAKSGIRSLIIRQAEYGACPWCEEVAGSYDYREVKGQGNDVWRRHENCRCTIDYITERNNSFYTERVNNQKK